MRPALSFSATLLALAPVLGGCSLQGTYDHAARTECGRLVDVSERRACFDRVEENSREREARRRD